MGRARVECPLKLKGTTILALWSPEERRAVIAADGQTTLQNTVLKDWRTDRALRRLEALMAVAGREALLLISGSGDVVEPDDGILGLGSGGPYALAAARALRAETTLSVREIAEKALRIAADIDVYTNAELVIEELEW